MIIVTTLMKLITCHNLTTFFRREEICICKNKDSKGKSKKIKKLRLIRFHGKVGQGLRFGSILFTFSCLFAYLHSSMRTVLIPIVQDADGGRT